MVMSFSTDWRFTTARAREIVQALMEAEIEVSFADIEAQFGHDSFLMDIPEYLRVFGTFMQSIKL